MGFLGVPIFGEYLIIQVKNYVILPIPIWYFKYGNPLLNASTLQ